MVLKSDVKYLNILIKYKLSVRWSFACGAYETGDAYVRSKNKIQGCNG